MSEYKLDGGIPIPVKSESPEEADVAPEIRVKRNGCRLAEHKWQPYGTREKCSKCGDIFPCQHDCRHIDCRDKKGIPQEDWITEWKGESSTNTDATIQDSLHGT